MKTDNWKEFRIGDLFNQVSKTFKTKTYRKLKVREDKFSIPALSSTTTNNGFGFYVKACDHDVITYTCLSVASNGDAGKVFVQTLPFAIAQDSYVLYLKNGIESENIYLFLATVMEKVLISKYHYDDKAVWSKVQNDFIKLPAKGDKPDWAYMEEFIRNIKDKVIERYDNYRKDEIKKALESTGLTYEDLKGNLEVKSCDRYEKFKVEDLFKVLSSKKIYHANQISIFNNKSIDTYPYVVRSVNNRGIKGYIKEDEKTLNDSYTLSFAQDTFVCFYQKNKYYTGNKVKILKPLFNYTEKNLLFLETCINKIIFNKTWGDVSTVDFIKNLELTLPAIDEDNPDFAYMENVIYIYTKKVIKNWNLSRKEIIEKMEKIK